MIDEQGFRANVGIILCNQQQQVVWARRCGGYNAWQFPQGGIQAHETPEEAMYRELHEELGLLPKDVACLAATKDWLSYLLPEKFIRTKSKPLCIGQKQRWFLLRLASDDSCIQLDASERPEFDQWRWVDYWHPVTEIVDFKREVYQAAMKELEYYL